MNVRMLIINFNNGIVMTLLVERELVSVSIIDNSTLL